MDTRIIDDLSSTFEVRIFAIVQDASLTRSPVPLEIKARPAAAASTILRMVFLREPYQEAKFRFSRSWKQRRADLTSEIRINPPDLIVTSQWPGLLMAEQAGLYPNLHIAHNVDTVLAENFDPAIFHAIRNVARMREREKGLLRRPVAIAAISRSDARRISDWGIPARPISIPLTVRPATRPSTFALGFIGKTSWPPNRTAIDGLVGDLLPILKSRLGSDAPRIILAGRGSEQWANSPGVEAWGEVAELDRFYRSIDLVVIPRTGTTTGISVKLMEAVEHGICVIAPSNLIEDAGSPPGCIPADTIPEMATAVVDFSRSQNRLSHCEPTEHGSVIGRISARDLLEELALGDNL